MQVIEVEYECCGAKYEFPTRLASDALILANSELADNLVAEADVLHDAEHPECEDN
jgi:hypothetical protein